MILDLVALAGIVLWAAVGWRRGLLAMCLGFLALAAGYAAAFAFHRPAGSSVAGALDVSPLVATVLASLGLFLLAAGTVRLLGRGAVRRRAERVRNGWRPSALDRMGGAVAGAVTAGVVVLLLAWGGSALASVLRPVDGTVATAPSQEPPGDPVAETTVIERSLVGRLGTAAAERGVEAAVRAAGGDGRTAAATAVLVARPAEARHALQTLADTDAARDVVAADDLREAFYRGDTDAVAADPRVRRFFEDPQVRGALTTLRMVDPQTESPDDMARELARTLGPVGPAVERLRGDPDFAEALERSRLRERLASGDVSGLAGDPDVVWMMGRVRQLLAGDGPQR